MYQLLLVDDSRAMRRLLRDTLEIAGFEDSKFIEAVNGEDALKALAAVDYKVDAIFCDLCMPTMDGLSLLSALKARGGDRPCPVIVLTADARKTHGREALLRGAAALLHKPFTPETVAETLRRVLSAQISSSP